jgi:hypothetical protein
LLAYKRKDFDLMENISIEAIRRSNGFFFELVKLFTIEKRSNINISKFEVEWCKLNKENALEESLEVDEVYHEFEDMVN